jgi:hypothetical protein
MCDNGGTVRAVPNSHRLQKQRSQVPVARARALAWRFLTQLSEFRLIIGRCRRDGAKAAIRPCPRARPRPIVR